MLTDTTNPTGSAPLYSTNLGATASSDGRQGTPSHSPGRPGHSPTTLSASSALTLTDGETARTRW
jgi:hypothetical protein